MKNKFILAIMLLSFTMTITSCYSTRSKVGCPATAETGRRFRN